ncbi:hypothetical protein Tsubulata_021597 [Turnera subulata]|uniref:PPM-type phosphatase domain-containing protein n=1 Tax=Turnera subulata TaxID=218843 RepID=A0A9Q0G6Z0_9ROSI|nr:hypothetical protein Tsubulata_021597 [Turnera subulata]
MVCSSCVRSVLLQAGVLCKTRVGRWGNVGRSLNAGRFGVNFSWNRCDHFAGTSLRMMVDSASNVKGVTMHDMLPEKDDDGGYASGGWKSEDGNLSCGFSSFRGKRATMEDFYDIKNSKIDGRRVCMFGIFDEQALLLFSAPPEMVLKYQLLRVLTGHGGSHASEYLKDHLFGNLMKHPQFISDTKLAISETYQQTDVDFLNSEKDSFRDDGSTASTAVLVGNHLYVANVGDSRTVVSKDGKAIPLSEDHKPNRTDERKRIESAGGVVMWAGTWRVGGVLAMSRAFGNRMLKQYVVAEPEIQVDKDPHVHNKNTEIPKKHGLTSFSLSLCLSSVDIIAFVYAVKRFIPFQDVEVDEDFELLVLASDGLWDVVPNEDAVSIAQTEEEPEAAARKLTEAAFTRGSADNITCIVVRFHHNVNSARSPDNANSERSTDKATPASSTDKATTPAKSPDNANPAKSPDNANAAKSPDNANPADPQHN